jgi:SPP1 family predicted phage head-tail adaptor
MINFGKYDQKVSFVNFQAISDGAGGTTVTPTTSLTTFAAVTQRRANNDLESGEMVLPNTYEFRIQFRASFVPSESFQILYQSKYHKITGVQLDQQRQHKEYIITAVGV